MGAPLFYVIASDGEINSATREDSEPGPIDDDGIEIPPPSHNESKTTRLQSPTASLLSCLRPEAMCW